MIVDAIFSVFFGLMSALVGLLPDASSLGLTSSSGLWIGYAQLNAFLPLTEVVAMVGLWLTVHLAVYAYLGLRAIRGWLPFV